MKKHEVLFLNLSELPVSNMRSELETMLNIPVHEVKLQVSINLGAPNGCYQQIVNLIDTHIVQIDPNMYVAKWVGSSDGSVSLRDQLSKYEFVMMIPPALSIAAVYVVNEIHATTNTLPFILELDKIKEHNGALGVNISYKLKRIRSLEKEKLITRNRRSNGSEEKVEI